MNQNLTIILPTLNEEENLKLLIPNIVKVICDLNINNYEILVIDDGSDDNTEKLIANYNDKKIQFHLRNDEKSLPLSISYGIQFSKYENVMWLDADGSMNDAAIRKLLEKFKTESHSCIIGSRFVENGGYKGIEETGKTSFFRAMYNVSKSNDSITATVLSKIFNNILYLISPSKIKDLTSGFIIINKKYIDLEIFEKSSYGDYFIYLIHDLYTKKVKMVEVGYLCETRIHGESKTGSSLFQLIKRGIPYISAVIKCRMNINENL